MYINIVHHFVLLRSILVLYGDWEGWWFEHSVSWLQVCFLLEGVKNVSWPGYRCL